MRQYYASDKKRREEAKRKQQEQKRLKRMNKGSKNSTTPSAEGESNIVTADSNPSGK